MREEKQFAKPLVRRGTAVCTTDLQVLSAVGMEKHDFYDFLSLSSFFLET